MCKRVWRRTGLVSVRHKRLLIRISCLGPRRVQLSLRITRFCFRSGGMRVADGLIWRSRHLTSGLAELIGRAVLRSGHHLSNARRGRRCITWTWSLSVSLSLLGLFLQTPRVGRVVSNRPLIWLLRVATLSVVVLLLLRLLSLLTLLSMTSYVLLSKSGRTSYYLRLRKSRVSLFRSPFQNFLLPLLSRVLLRFKLFWGERRTAWTCW